MEPPQVGDRIRANTVATVLAVQPPNASGNVRCILQAADGRLAWIIYYPGGTRSNINFYREDQAPALRDSLGSGQRKDSGEEAE